MNLQNDQFLVGLIVLLIKHCIGITEVMGSNLVQAWIFFSGIKFRNCLKCVYNCDDQSYFFNKHIWKTIVLSKDDAMYRIGDIFNQARLSLLFLPLLEESKSEWIPIQPGSAKSIFLWKGQYIISGA